MPALKVKVKWGRETFTDVECNTDQPPLNFKSNLQKLTGVEAKNQKVMTKGKILSSETWENFPITDGAMLLMMGTKTEEITKDIPKEPVKFAEDLTEAELATAQNLPLGLANLGNTCYMNATVQCLKSVPILTEHLKKFDGRTSATENSTAITAALRDVFDRMDKGVDLPPLALVSCLHRAFPQFAERGEGGVWMQQDASECWTQLVRMLSQTLHSDKSKSIIDEYFGVRLATSMKNDENEEEPPVESVEESYQLSCFITTEVRYMQSGLMGKLTEKISKYSESLGRDATYTKTSRVDRLPAYLTVQMVRFFYKEKEGKNAKILKDVKFPLSFDAFDLCSKSLQNKLTPMREKFRIAEDAAAQLKSAKKDASQKKQKVEESKKPKNFHPFSFPDDNGSNNSGFYELQAILTHKGRTSNSGHYVAWVKYEEDVWLMCDDEHITPVTSEDVLKLSGGGDWHIAYVLIYGPRQLEITEESKTTETAAAIAEPEKMDTNSGN